MKRVIGDDSVAHAPTVAFLHSFDLGTTEPPLCSASRKTKDDNRSPSNFAPTALPETGDRARRRHKIYHGGCGLADRTGIGFDNKILRFINRLCHIRQPALHYPG
jgi:hypothetical protein